ncbi:phytanoyl-CoA dioxygenase family protein [Terriglobus saanensis]|uniref:Phytanoyl-CoA dioxygenase n=1 Tax=Terriglobus saanensis (strain ATCC BAA-1853 / DSM 23119 / SP1PR4) TaxID=401053 RepID=E8UX72_TERSS|nr:phytanoyl-CoA dioxygenase family protein [Terriglobus saanensis]ADV83035.1 Phytanoyl-CoA dioxygenase [Terriglobus saanensis SP1PR4]
MLVAETALDIYSCGERLDSSANRLGYLREANELLGNADLLRQRMAEDGYLLLRGLLNRDQVLAARRDTLEQLADQGQLDPDAPLMDGIQKPGTSLFFQPELAQKNNRPLQKLLYAEEGELMSFFRHFLGGPTRHFDFTWLRCISPGRGTPSHCDVVFMGRGTRKLYTAWVPLGKVDFEAGGLMVLENSHKNQELQKSYGAKDVDSYCENDPSDGARMANGYNGWLSESPTEIRRQLGGRWLVSEYEAGDVVIFSVDLVHGGMDNRSNHLRLSSDSRYQLASEPIDERWVGENPPGHGSAGKRGRIC